MGLRGAVVFAVGVLFVTGAANAEGPQSLIQRAVNSERAANQTDHSNWLYREEVKKPKETIEQWVAATQHGDVHRIYQRNGQRVPDAKQQDAVQDFLHNEHAQKKSVDEDAHDAKQIDDFLKLLPEAFIWTEKSTDAVNTTLHFEPDPKFHPPTREAKVFSGMVGDVVVDNQQLRIRSMSGHLVHEVTFGGGLLGKLKEGSTFALAQEQTAPSLWQLTSLHVHLVGSALLFKSVSLEEDDERTKFELQSPNETVEQAGALVMRQVE